MLSRAPHSRLPRSGTTATTESIIWGVTSDRWIENPMPDYKLRILVLLIPPVCLFLAFRHRLDDYSLSDLPSVSLPFYHSSSTVRQSCSPEQWSNGAWVARKRTTGVEDGVFAASQFEGCASNFAPTWHLGTFPEEVLTQKRFDKGGYEWVPTDDCIMKPFAKEDLIRDLVESGGWMLIGGTLPLPISQDMIYFYRS